MREIAGRGRFNGNGGALAFVGGTTSAVARQAMLSLGQISILFIETLIACFTPPYRVSVWFNQMVQIGYRSLPIVTITALFTGMVLAFQTAYQLSRFGAEMYVGGIVAISMARELAPVLTALVVAGRVGAGITAELGTMLVTEQVDALETMAVNRVNYLVVPRFIAGLFMLPLLTVYANFVGFLGGYLVGVMKLGINSALYLNRAFYIVAAVDLFNGLFKTFFFGAIIAIVGCHMGLHCRGGAEGVGRATTQSVVVSSMLILMADYFLTALLYLT